MKRTLFHLVLTVALIGVASGRGVADDREGVDAKGRAPSGAMTEKASKKSKLAGAKKESQPAKKVDMFAAMDEGLITVDYIGKDATQANLIFRNRGNESLDIVLPETFGAVPVVAQGMMG
ncbi:MAG: hypothetical protein WCI02_13005, partial [Planctomycetota bacterium]